MRQIVLIVLFLPSMLLAQQPLADTQVSEGLLSASASPEPRFSTDPVSPAAPRSSEAPLSMALEMQGYGADYRPHGAQSDLAAVLHPLAPENPYSKKSPFLAGLFSAIIPGTGELYAGSYWLAGLFAALEGAGWYFNVTQNKKGDDETVVFEGYADEHWSAVKYAEWLNANAKNFPGGENAVQIDIDPDASLPHWQRINWDQMHATEMAIPQFSHKLPPHGDQQYFELIGKYNQYSYGWDDKTGGDYWNPSDRFLYYAGLRGEANDHYNTADTILNLIILNHVLSAIDAAWAAARFNQFVELYSHAQLQRLPDGRADLVASAQFSIRF
ncbi:MAG: hypothetical protein IH600_14915 [Bacteroidetes bacterium]|nr:hypothetical protein [Bacteroidota bacterium]